MTNWYPDRDAAKGLGEDRLRRCEVLPFFDGGGEEGRRLYYYDFGRGRPVVANAKGEFVAEGGKGGGRLVLPKEVGGERGLYEKKTTKKQVRAVKERQGKKRRREEAAWVRRLVCVVSRY